MTTLVPRPVQLAQLATVTPAVEAAVHAWKAARIVREAAWAEYEAQSVVHRQREVREGRKIRRPRAFVLAERQLDPTEHQVSRAEAEIEMQLRIANPGADNRSIMATKRELTRSGS